MIPYPPFLFIVSSITMKPTQLLSAFLLLTLSTTGLAASPEPVLDTDGNELKRGVEYYVEPGITDIGGALTLASRNNSCPLKVALAVSGADDGLPVTFRPADTGEETIKTLTDLNIVFEAATICVQSTVWRLEFDEAAGRCYVGTGGTTGNPGPATVSNWFRIEKFGSAGGGVYKLVFCPQVCDVCKVVCGDLGVYYEDGRRWLGIRNEAPLPVEFKRAGTGTQAS